jgi:hypothetical protein
MNRIRTVAASCFIVMLCVLFLAKLPALAQDANLLSRDIEKELRSAKSLMFKGKAEEAHGLLDEIQGKIDELKSSDPKHSSIKGIERDYDKLKKDLSRRIGKETGTSKGEKSAVSETTSAGSDKLNSAAGRYVRKMDEAMKGVDRSLNSKSGTPESRIKAAQYEMKKVEGYWNDLQKKYPDTLGHPDVVVAKGRMDAYYDKIGAYGKTVSEEKAKEGQVKAAKKAGSNEWIAKLTPYVLMRGQQGYVPKKEFVASYTEDPKDMDQRMKLYVEASNLFDEFQKAQFPEGKTDELLDLEKKLAFKLKTYNEELKMAADRYFEKAASEIKRGKSNLDGNEERTKDGKTKPILLHALVLNGIARDIAWAENLMPGDSRIPELKKEFEALQKEQARWREKMIESTVMISHKFNGKESSALKEMSENIVKKKFSDAKILRVNVISSDWKEERALEYTDTTRTAIRYRITQSVTGQVAAKRGDDCFLYTTYMAKNRLSDGSWGQYYGHIMFTDRMLEKNLNK